MSAHEDPTDRQIIAALVLREGDLTPGEALRLSTWKRLVEKGIALTDRERRRALELLDLVTR